MIDPDGRSAEKVDNEYVKDKKTGEVRQVGTTGGDEFDIVSEGTFHDDGSVSIDGSTTEVVDVGFAVNDMSEVWGREPGNILIPGQSAALATLDGADDPIFNILSGRAAVKFAGGFLPYLRSYADDLTSLGFAKILPSRVPKGHHWLNTDTGIWQKGGTFINKAVEYLKWGPLKAGQKLRKSPKLNTSRGGSDSLKRVEDEYREFLENGGRKLNDIIKDGDIGF